MEMKKRTAVVILNWNGKEMMKRFLPSVIENTPEAEVIVADNGSSDGSCEMLENSFPQVTILKLDKNYGFAEGYNKALGQLEHEYFVLLNSDVEVSKYWLAKMLDYMDEHPDVAACQPKLLSQIDKKRFEYAGAAGGFIDRYGYPFCRGRIFSTVEEDKNQYDDVCSLFWATGAALMIRSADWQMAGGLDGSFFAHMEEIDLCWRLRARGRKIVCVPSSAVYHVGGGTLPKENPRKTFLNFRNNLLMLYKNLPEEELNGVMLARTLLDWLAALQFFISGKMGDAKAVLKARREFSRIKNSYKASRKENQKKAIQNDIAERFNCCLLVKYYVRSCKTFTQLLSKMK